jgi:N-acetylmuramoyl-L-alanine amidase
MKKDKIIAGIVTIVMVLVVLIFTLFGKVGDLEDTVWGKTKSSVWFNVQQKALEEAEKSIAAKEREEALIKAWDEMKEPEPKEETTKYSRKEMVAQLIARVVYAESWIEGEYGWRLVADVILNRMESDRFPNDIWAVIAQKNQFETWSNGRISRAPVKDEIVDIVLEEMGHRTDSTILFFTAGGYNEYCVPMYQYKHHYFGR